MKFDVSKTKFNEISANCYRIEARKVINDIAKMDKANTQVMVLDDVGIKACLGLMKKQKPHCMIETSEGIYQMAYFIEAIEDVEEDNKMLKWLGNKGFKAKFMSMDEYQSLLEVILL